MMKRFHLTLEGLHRKISPLWHFIAGTLVGATILVALTWGEHDIRARDCWPVTVVAFVTGFGVLFYFAALLERWIGHHRENKATERGQVQLNKDRDC